MSRSRHSRCSRGRGCGVCGDAGAPRRAREDDAVRVDERELGDPRDVVQTDAALARADAPALVSPRCDRETCATWRPCPACKAVLEAEAADAHTLVNNAIEIVADRKCEVCYSTVGVFDECGLCGCDVGE